MGPLIKQYLQFQWEYDILVEWLGLRLQAPQIGKNTFYTQEVSILRQVKQCRMVKQVIWICDVFSAEGKNIAPSA